MTKNPNYDPEIYYRHEVNKIQSKLKAEGQPDSIIDDGVFLIESLALRCGYKSYLKDVTNRLVKYLDAGMPLPTGMSNYLSAQLKCIANGEDANNVFNIKGGKGIKPSHALRDMEIYDFLKAVDTKKYSLQGSKKKESAFEYAAKYFCVSEGTIKQAYERASIKEKSIISIQNKISEKRIFGIIKDFEEYKSDGGDMQPIDYAKVRLGLINPTQE